MNSEKPPVKKQQQKALLKAALCKPINLFVLGVGLIAGKFSFMLIPVGVMAYGILCYLDFSSQEFAETCEYRASKSPHSLPEISPVQSFDLSALEQELHLAAEKLQHRYQQADELAHDLLGDFFHIDEVINKSDALLIKAQKIQEYLTSENVERIRQGIAMLEHSIMQADDAFAKKQYQQALEARQHHLHTFYELQQMYGRLISQLTNISISLDSLSSKLIKLSTMEQQLASAEGEQVADRLQGMLTDMEQLDAALNDRFSHYAP